MEYVKHLEAGKKAAKYILYRWPETFMYKKLDSVSKMVVTLDFRNLLDLIQDPVVFEKKPLESMIVVSVSFFSDL